MLRSLDHVGRSRGSPRRGAATAARWRSPGARPAGLAAPASRERFLAAYRAGLREAGAPIVLDPTLLRAFELDKECCEFIYAATYLPSWLWAPTEGLRGLFDAPGQGRA